jgi:hypothetical protein
MPREAAAGPRGANGDDAEASAAVADAIAPAHAALA